MVHSTPGVPVLRMAGRPGAELAEPAQLGLGKVVADDVQEPVQQGRAVTRRQDEAITIRPVRCGRSWRRCRLHSVQAIGSAASGNTSNSIRSAAKTTRLPRNGGSSARMLWSASSPVSPARSAAAATGCGSPRTVNCRNCLFATEESNLRALLRGGADDAAIEHAWRVSVAGKGPGHTINSTAFRRPERPMSAIGG